jgi:hypothetical protein
VSGISYVKTGALERDPIPFAVPHYTIIVPMAKQLKEFTREEVEKVRLHPNFRTCTNNKQHNKDGDLV